MPPLRVSRKNDLAPQEYSEAMMMELESADDNTSFQLYVDSEK